MYDFPWKNRCIIDTKNILYVFFFFFWTSWYFCDFLVHFELFWRIWYFSKHFNLFYKWIDCVVVVWSMLLFVIQSDLYVNI